jgi:pyruvate,water dikinase
MTINPKEINHNTYGGKGFQLTLLKNICTVPEFFVINFKEYSELADISNQNEILNHFDSLDFDCVSVRSSATVEDGTYSAFAGVFKTKLYVHRDKLFDAIFEVLKSVEEDVVKSHCVKFGLDYKLVEVRIVVQKMINSRISGVCFTKEKSTKFHNCMRVDAILGVGEYYVGGVVSSDGYLIDRTTFDVKSATVSVQNKMLRNGIKEDVPFTKSSSKKIIKTELQKLAKQCLEIENKLKYDIADIEWAFDEDQLYILQVRPFLGII